jgi:uncharacterized membrane protein YccC
MSARYDAWSMGKTLKALGTWLATGPNRIALSTALRGTIASAAPLALLPSLGQGAIAYPAVLGALATSMVDVGGPYRSRLVAMLIQGLGGACLLLLGTLAVGHWWLAALAMAAIGIVSGLARALGPGGASLGINTAVAFLVGLPIGSGGGATPDWVVGYAAGGLWTILVALAFWQFRPYRRLEQEVASAWEAVAALVAAVAAKDAAESVVARRRREQAVAASHAAAREAVEQARGALGEMRAGTAGPGTTIAQLTVVLNAAARIGAAAVTLGELEAPADAPRAAGESALQDACAAVARILLAGKGELSLAELRLRLKAAQAAAAAGPPPADLLAWAQAMRHLDNAEEALRQLFGERRRLPELLRLALAHRGPRGAVLAALRPHLSPRSAIFRHALRVASVTAVGTAIIVRFDLPHGIWLPLTSLVILQPDYGGTVARAVERSGGTVAGAVLAGALLATLRGTVEYDVALALLLFATFLLIRRRYGYAITFLTPLIILLIGMGSPNPWIDLADRIAYTVAGAMLAIAAGYLLWPRWEREQLRERVARAVRADRDYLAAVLAALAGKETPAPLLAQLRRQAELAVANADAGFQRMLAEPTRHAPVTEGFSLLIYLHRLCRHAIALAAQLGAAAPPPAPLSVLAGLIGAALADVGQALDAGRAPSPRPGFDASLAQISAALAAGGDGSAVAPLLGRAVSDVTGLIAAAAAAQRVRPAAEPSGRSRWRDR